MFQSPTRHRVAFGLALLGLVVSAEILYVEYQLATDSGYTSFCNLGGVINCDVVLGSRYGRVLDVPARWRRRPARSPARPGGSPTSC
jgi:uncharacterized membrane protein